MIAENIAGSLGLQSRQVSVVLDLFADGATLPFIARYRKDRTGGLDEVQLAEIQSLHRSLTTLEERRQAILKALAEKGVQDAQLIASIRNAQAIQLLEDLYAPYKTRRKTRADQARECGLEPLARSLMSQRNFDVYGEAGKFIGKEVAGADAALQGARDIIAEWIADDVDLKGDLRKLFAQKGALFSKVVRTKAEEAVKYRDYFDFKESLRRLAGHRFLAITRGAGEGFLRISIEPPVEEVIARIDRKYLKNRSEAAEQVAKAIDDAYKRLLQPALENEFRAELKDRADQEAIDVFAKNLRQLLLASPLGEKTTLAIDPGYRTGCKVVVLDASGDLVDTDLIYVHEPSRLTASQKVILRLIEKHKVEAIGIGDGTAGRETERFIKSFVRDLPVFLVNEDGASIYSASGLAREEFPGLDLTFRGAVSIGRRLMDPLAELVKIDPKSIGVGQYQHDVHQGKLREKLDQTVESCVNAVGVNLNTAGKSLLSYISGIGPVLAENIVRYRNDNGAFRNRKELLKVPRLGAKAFQLAAGFLRIKDGTDVLDSSGVHPESYGVIKKIASDLRIKTGDLIANPLLESLDTRKYMDEEHGTFALKDIIAELKKPGLDPRETATAFEYAAVYSIDDLETGMTLPGQVTNLTKFGAFVDIGIKQDGMVHISEITDRFIKDPSEVLHLNQKVMVRVLDIDRQRNRIQLSMKNNG